MDPNSKSPADILPVTVFHPVGLASAQSRLSEERFIQKIQVPARTDVKSPVKSLEVYPLYEPEQVAELVEVLVRWNSRMRQKSVTLIF